jgi:RNA polymerase sigma-70 factor (ECF subfamily)
MQVSDGGLVSRVLGGDVGAFNALARRWQKPLYNFAYRYTGHVEEAEDICQEALSRAYAHLARLRDPERFGSWLYAIAYRMCQDRGRRKRRRVEVSTDEMAEAGVDPSSLLAGAGREAGGEDPEDLVEANELGELLHRALQKLPEEQRVALVLREYQGYTSGEIARLLEVPVATVRSRIFYGLKSMRRMLGRNAIGQEFLKP